MAPPTRPGATVVARNMRVRGPVPSLRSYVNLTGVLVPGLRATRLERALSQEQLAERSGVGRKTISRGERGLEIRVSSVRRLAEALRVSPLRLQQPPRH